jgi:hypothetical protein
VSLFRRSEPLHVRLAREGGIPFGEQRPRPPWDVTGVHGLHRPRRWDAVVTVEAPELDGERATFVVLPDGTLVIEDGPDDLAPLASAIETELSPPYRAEAVRRDGGLWAVAASSIEVVALPGVGGVEIELVSHGTERTLVVDGERSFGTIAGLERHGHVVRASRIDGELWEIETDPL